MLDRKKIAVVIPAYNEQKLIGQVMKTMPNYVDAVYVIDDCSTDDTVKTVKSLGGKKVKLLQMERNSGVGAAIVRGYRQAAKDGMDVVAVMAGDAQMDPGDLQNILTPVIEEKADYVKGNRLFTGEAWNIIPKHRYLGNAFLSLFTKISSGYWHLADSQTGYTAISAKVIHRLPLESLYPRYGYPNHILAMLNVHRQRVRDVPVRPIYNIGEKSGIRLWAVTPRLALLLLKNFLWRIREVYIIRDFHPLIFFYSLAVLLLGVSIPLLIRLIIVWSQTANFPPINSLAFIFTAITGFQSLFFAMWFDMEYNKDLR